MTQSNFLELAQQGNPQVIAGLLNRSLKPKGIVVKGTRSHNQLHLLIESASVPDQEVLVRYLQQALNRLKVPPTEVMIYARQLGELRIAWQERLELDNYPIPAPPTLSELEVDSKGARLDMPQAPSQLADISTVPTDAPPSSPESSPATMPEQDKIEGDDFLNVVLSDEPFEPNPDLEASEEDTAQPVEMHTLMDLWPDEIDTHPARPDYPAQDLEITQDLEPQADVEAPGTDGEVAGNDDTSLVEEEADEPYSDASSEPHAPDLEPSPVESAMNSGPSLKFALLIAAITILFALGGAYYRFIYYPQNQPAVDPNATGLPDSPPDASLESAEPVLPAASTPLEAATDLEQLPPVPAHSDPDTASISPSAPEAITAEVSSSPTASVSPVASPSPVVSRPVFWREGINAAGQAAAQAQAANNQQDWQSVVIAWEGAIQLMQQVPKDDSNYAAAQKKIEEYTKNLTYARQNASR